jgi:plastocyanin
MKRLKRIQSALLFKCLLGVTILAAPLVARADSWRAMVGAQSDDKGMQVLAFLPNEMWIHAGDSITWNFVTSEDHTVTFLKSGQVRLPFNIGCPGTTPDGSTTDGSTCVNSGPLTGGSYSVTFSTAGNFKLVCLIHANMTATVHVLPLFEPLPHDQEFYDDQAAAQSRALLSDSDRVGRHQDHDSGGESENESSDHHGVTAGIGEIVATGGGTTTISLMRFSHRNVLIHVGDTVEWTNFDPVTAHTITFGVEPANLIPPSSNVTVDLDGARHVTLHSPADSAHSGFIVAGTQDRIGLPQPPSGVTRFRATFVQPGVFPYICALHDGLGMTGEIVVLP